MIRRPPRSTPLPYTALFRSIGELLTDGLEPRAGWWIYKYYAESHRSRVQSTTNQRFIVPYASLTPGEDSEEIGRAHV